MVLIQIMLRFDNQMRGINMVVGTIIFSIVEDLGFVRSQFHRYFALLQVRIGLGLLRRRQILGG